jgi:signal transduction histidine kinase
LSAAVHTALAGWPLAGALATALVSERLRAARRRAALNRALHELRRPVQLLALSPAGPRVGTAATALDLIIAALAQLDREVNGGVQGAPQLVGAEDLVRGAVARWRAGASQRGASISLRTRAGDATVLADPAKVAQALDNLIANALEHGGPTVIVEARAVEARLRITVADDGAAARSERGMPPSAFLSRAGLEAAPRRGHGLEVVRAVAAAHGGRFALQRSERGSVAILELPLAGAGNVLAA